MTEEQTEGLLTHAAMFNIQTTVQTPACPNHLALLTTHLVCKNIEMNERDIFPTAAVIFQSLKTL